jgi:hypothetical protein
MDDFELIDELLELTLASQQPDATTEERARLERLLADNPQAILWYLRIVDDTLTLIDDATAAASTQCAGATIDRPSTTRAPRERVPAVARIVRNLSVATAAIAGTLIVAFAALRYWQLSDPSHGAMALAVDEHGARVVKVSGVEWVEGAHRFNEWDLIQPGDKLQIKAGWINVFLSGGAELLIAGPADVKYISPQRVFARQGKLAARIGPGAVGFRIDTPQANVIDRGTSFGVSIDGDGRTSVVVYEGRVDLDVVGGQKQPRRQLASGEALRVDDKGHLSRITTVQSDEFLEPPQVMLSGTQSDGLITAVSDNVRSLETAKYYRVIPHGFREDARAYVDRMHEWNGVDRRGLPPFLLGGDYVMTFNDDKIVNEIEIGVTLGKPANLFVLIDDRVTPPEWLQRDFVDTNWDVGSDEGWGDHIIDVAAGPGKSVEHVFSVWRRVVNEPATVVLGAISQESPPPSVEVERSMYGVVATPLSRAVGGMPGR